jgi:hypothetical protein
MAFDPAVFMNTSYEAAFEIKRALVPEGDYAGVIKGMPEFSAGRDEGTVVMKVAFRLICDAAQKVAEEQNREELLLTQWIYLDVDKDDNNIILYGANQSLDMGRLRAALGQNDPTKSWNPGMLDSAGPLLLKIVHRAMKDSDGKATGELKDTVARYAKMPE